MAGHSAYLIYQVILKRVIQRIIPNLGRKSNAQRNFGIAMIVITLFGAIAFGIYLDGYFIHAPSHYTGLCPSPAEIHGSGQSCTLPTVETVTKGSTTQITTVQVPAGHVVIENTTTVTVTK